MQEVVYIYEYVLVFFSKSWVRLGIQGHTPGAATDRKYLDVYLISSLYGSVGIVGVVDFQDLVVTKLEI